MTLQEVADDFVFRYKLECENHGKLYRKMSDNMVALLISKGLQDVQRRIGVWQKTSTISMVAGTSVYDLPATCGVLRKIFISDFPMVKVAQNELIADETDSGLPVSYCEYEEEGTQKIMVQPTPSQNYTATIFYFVKTNYFSPSASTTAQDWGQLYTDGNFYGNFKMSDVYEEAVILYCLSKLFPNTIPLYLAEVGTLRDSHAVKGYAKMPYSFGLPSRNRLRGTTGTAGVVTSSVVTSGEKPIKELRFEIHEGSEAVQKYLEGFGAITITDVAGEITVASSAEFTNYTFIDPNNDNVTYELLNPNEILLHAGTGYGYLAVNIKVFS